MILPIFPPRSLRWLLWANFRASLRSVGRRFSLAGLYIVLIAITLVVVSCSDHVKFLSFLSKVFYLLGPMLLMLFSLFGARTGLSNNPFYYSAAETTFLLAAPFHRGHLFAYKIFHFNVMTAMVSALAALVLGRSMPQFLDVFVKVYLVIFFIQGLPIAMSTLLPNRTTAVSRFVRLTLDLSMGLLLLSVSAAIYFELIGQSHLSRLFAKLLHEMTKPFFFADTYLVPMYLPEHRASFLKFLIPDLAFLLIFVLGYRRLELESVFYKNLHESEGRRTVLKGLGMGPGKLWKAIPLRWFPHWGGLGPLLWRKTQEYLRNYASVFVLSTVLAVSFIGFCIFLCRIYPPDEAYGMRLWQLHSAAHIFAIIGVIFSGFCDFRSDTHQVAYFKTWPIGIPRIVLGQVALSTFHLVYLMTALSLVGSFVFRVYAERDVLVYTLWNLSVVPFGAFFAANVDNALFLAVPVPISKLSGRTLGKLLGQFGSLVVLNILIARLFFFIDERGAIWAREHGDSHLAFVATAIAFYTLAGAAVFFLNTRLFRRFDPSKVR